MRRDAVIGFSTPINVVVVYCAPCKTYVAVYLTLSTALEVAAYGANDQSVFKLNPMLGEVPVAPALRQKPFAPKLLFNELSNDVVP